MRRTAAIAATALFVALFVPGRASGQVRYLDPIFSEIQATTNIVYGNSVNYLGQAQDLKLDLYEPADDTEPKRAVFIWAHGGGFTSSDKSEIGVIAEFMASRGWVTISIDYRLNPTLPSGITGYVLSGDIVYNVLRGTAAVRDAQHDMQAAVRWVHRNADDLRIDPNRIAVGGQSAGATLAMGVAFNSDDPGDSGNAGYPSNVQAAIGTGTGNLPFVDVHPDPLVEPPVAMFHGEADSSMPYVVPLATCLAAQALLNVCEFRTYAGLGHDKLVGINDWPAFLYKYVQPAPPLVPLPTGSAQLIPDLRVPPGAIPQLPIPTLPPELTELLPI